LIAHHLILSQQKAPIVAASSSHNESKPKFNVNRKSESVGDDNRSIDCVWKEKKGEKNALIVIYTSFVSQVNTRCIKET